jgi:hypothetical protein
MIDSFPNTSLPTIQGEPTYTQLAQLRNAIKANAASIPSTRGGDTNGCLGMVVSDAVYVTIAPGTPFIKPTKPGPHVIFPGGPLTAAETAVLVRIHTESFREWREHNNLQRALKKTTHHSSRQDLPVGTQWQ